MSSKMPPVVNARERSALSDDMKSHLLGLLERELARQCTSARIALYDLRIASRRGESDRVWYAAQGLLVAVGNISKILWPSNPESRGRRISLRSKLHLDETSPLNSRELRNHFEHFDERIEQWASTTVTGRFMEMIGPRRLLANYDPGDLVRHLDPDDLIFTVRGRTYDLKPVLAAVRDLHKKVRGRRAKRTVPAS